MKIQNKRPQILISDKKTISFIDYFFQTIDFKLPCEFEMTELETTFIKLGNRTFLKPVRIGQIIDILQAPQNHSEKIISFKGGKLDITNFIFINNETSAEVRLTEKEVAILNYLHENIGSTVSRKDLLSAVWEYAETVETHTLETHIYRLRQKIEIDPSNPQILLTDDNGYKILNF